MELILEKKTLKSASEQNIKVVARLNPSITQGFRTDEDKFDYNKDADRFVCPAGHMAIRKARGGTKDVGKNQVDTYYFDVEKCKSCPLKEGCYKDGAKTKTYSGIHKIRITSRPNSFSKKQNIIKKKQNTDTK